MEQGCDRKWRGIYALALRKSPSSCRIRNLNVDLLPDGSGPWWVPYLLLARTLLADDLQVIDYVLLHGQGSLAL